MQEAVEAQSHALGATNTDVLLTPGQTAYLQQEATPKSLAVTAIAYALMVPVMLGAMAWGLTKLVSRVPLIGWLLGIYGLILTVVVACAGMIVIPITFLGLFAHGLLVRGSRLRRDVEGGRAVQVTGTFPVKLWGDRGGRIKLPQKGVDLNTEQMNKVRQGVDATGQFSGTIVYSPNAYELLGVERDGAVLVTRN